MIPPIEISATCRERRVRLSVGAAGGEAAIGATVYANAAPCCDRRLNRDQSSGARHESLVHRLCAGSRPQLLPGCERTDADAVGGRNSPPRPPPGAHFRDRFIDGFFELNPSFAVGQGRHEFDGQIGDWSDAGFGPPIEFLRAAIDGAAAFDAAQLSAAHRLRARLSRARARAASCSGSRTPTSRTPISTWYFDNGLDPNVYIARPYADAATRLRAFIAYARAVPAAARADPREPANADAALVRRIRHRGFQRLRGVLPRRRQGGLRCRRRRRRCRPSSPPSSRRPRPR